MKVLQNILIMPDVDLNTQDIGNLIRLHLIPRCVLICLFQIIGIELFYINSPYKGPQDKLDSIVVVALQIEAGGVRRV